MATVAVLPGCNKADKTQVKSAPIGPAATVNGEVISIDDFYNHMGVKQTAQVMSGRGATEVRVLGNFGLQAMQELVDQSVLLQMAKEQGVLPTEKDVDAELNFQTSLRPTYLNVLQEQGLTKEMIRHELLVGLAREHLIMKGVTVDPSEVDAFIKSHPEKFTEPARAYLLYIQATSSAKKSQVDAALAAGKSFESVATELSEAPNARDRRGVFPTTVISEMPKKIQAEVNATKERSQSGWLALEKSFVKFYVDRKEPAKQVSPTQPQRELIKRSIAMQRGQLKNDFDHKFFEKLRASKIDISVPYLKESWDKTWNQLSGPGARSAPNTRSK